MLLTLNTSARLTIAQKIFEGEYDARRVCVKAISITASGNDAEKACIVSLFVGDISHSWNSRSNMKHCSGASFIIRGFYHSLVS